jgi:hypothetical protein
MTDETKQSPLCLFASGLTDIGDEKDVCVLSDERLKLARRLFAPDTKADSRTEVVYDEDTVLYIVKLGAIAGPGTITFLQRNKQSGTVRLGVVFPKDERETVLAKLLDGRFYQQPVLWKGLQTLGGYRAEDIYHDLKKMRKPDIEPSEVEQSEHEVWKL